ncbi:MAG: TVP38/TMEM64 family protein [Planctomycetota bacterium]|jgi:uncharacterized membrane protein YdjX (TVP38/TMEM64 family)
MSTGKEARETPDRSLARPLILLASVVVCLAVVYVSPLHELFVPSGVERLRAMFTVYGAWSPAVFTLVCIGGVACGIPRLAFAAAAGVLFGWGLGFVLAHVGATTGNLLAFSWSRWLGRDFVARHAGRRLARLLDKIRRHPIATNVLLRVCPVGSSFMVTLMFGVSPVTAGQFAVGTFLGMLPGTLALALFGSSAAAGSTVSLLLGALLLAGMLIGYRLLSRRSTDAAELARDLERGEAP